MHIESKIFIAGGETFIGRALISSLKRAGYTKVLNQLWQEPNLLDSNEVDAFFTKTQPEFVFLTAGKSGGIEANNRYPADLLLDNLLVECHVIHSAYQQNVVKLLYLASSCSYPKHCQQPMKEEFLLSGHLEPTNEAYAVAKIAGIKLCEAYRRQHDVAFISGIPATAFGPGDDFSLDNSHVIPALIRKVHAARVSGRESVEIWGTGAAKREFIFVDDLADACIETMKKYTATAPINLGTGIDYTIGDLANRIKTSVNYTGKLIFDSSKPDGMPRKLLDNTTLTKTGWQPKTSFDTALSITCDWYINSLN